MKIKVVLSKESLNLLWCLSKDIKEYKTALKADEVVVELDEEIISQAIDLFEADSFDEAVKELCHLKLSEE